MNYWEKRDELSSHAQHHTIEMERRYGDRITESIKDSIIISDNESYIRARAGINPLTNVTITPSTSWVTSKGCGKWRSAVVQEDVIHGARKAQTIGVDLFGCDKSSTTVLNFASSTNPGGKFLQGSSAQEESICRRSTLYNVLASSAFCSIYADNKANNRGGIYQNRGIWTPSVIVTDDDDNEVTTVNVLTLPAPNLKAVQRFHGDQSVMVVEFRKRMRMMIQFMNLLNQSVLILGAWGCGVFGWPAHEVALMLKEELRVFNGQYVRFSIIDRKTTDIFKEVFDDGDQKTL